MTHWKKIVSDPNYIGEADFEENEEKILTIARVNVSETVVTAEGKSQKAVIHWREPGNKPMILNVARSKNIAKVAGTPDVERWPGVAVQLYIEHGIKAFGEVVSAVRVRPYKPRATRSQTVPPCADCGKPIQPAHNMTAERLAAYTSKNYGAPLCAECATHRAEKAAEVAQSAETSTENTEFKKEESGNGQASGGDSGELL